jgi:protein-tyrosine phosphatase
MTGFAVLFVCTGNLYRSPIAERLLTARLDSHSARFRVGSAGTRGRPGIPMSPSAAAVIRERGGEADGFVTRRLTAELVAAADLVLGLARQHREAAVRLHPTALRRCFTLEEFVRLTGPTAVGGGLPGGGQYGGGLLGAGLPGGGRLDPVAHAAAWRGRTPPVAADADDIEDPDGLPLESLRACADRIDRALRHVAAALTTPAPAVPTRNSRQAVPSSSSLLSGITPC